MIHEKQLSTYTWLRIYWILLVAGFVGSFAIFTATVQRLSFGYCWLPICFSVSFGSLAALFIKVHWGKRQGETRRRTELLIGVFVGAAAGTVSLLSPYVLGFFVGWLDYIYWLILFIGILYYGIKIRKCSERE